ncbi:hypothetical protein HHI36_007060 [Cryptolaemus montrouzieri]|uniref:RRM domain-containing protein n=1 Tax=Cryptolaemus montrouzieri TaxID=559131 RepID=A0ABD2MNH9_9CUCU
MGIEHVTNTHSICSMLVNSRHNQYITAYWIGLKGVKMSRYNSDCKVYVGDLGNNASKQDLEDAFGYYGPLRNVWVARNPPGFAFVEFEDARDAEDAVRGLGLLEYFFSALKFCSSRFKYFLAQ